ncbi:MAG: EF-hand domain-containing protein [Thioalkalispiraceae bacterium]|jgi:Ca2+-binding EF-hand superfamily protein
MKTLIITMMLTVSAISRVYAEIDEVKAQFWKLDINNDGLLTKEELQAQPEIARLTNLFNQRSFILADINEDGVIDVKEYVANEEIQY